MKTNEYMEQTEQYVLHTYNRFPLVIDHGEGVHCLLYTSPSPRD